MRDIRSSNSTTWYRRDGEKIKIVEGFEPLTSVHQKYVRRVLLPGATSPSLLMMYVDKIVLLNYFLRIRTRMKMWARAPKRGSHAAPKVKGNELWQM